MDIKEFFKKNNKKLFRVENPDYGGERYTETIVIASSEEEARKIHPEGYREENGEWKDSSGKVREDFMSVWVKPDRIKDLVVEEVDPEEYFSSGVVAKEWTGI